LKKSFFAITEIQQNRLPTLVSILQTLRRLESPIWIICEIFEAPRFLSFSTQSAAQSGRSRRLEAKCQSNRNGSDRKLWPVAANIALPTTGAIPGVPISPTPPISTPEFRRHICKAKGTAPPMAWQSAEPCASPVQEGGPKERRGRYGPAHKPEQRGRERHWAICLAKLPRLTLGRFDLPRR
jgi:hypothetical protein